MGHTILLFQFGDLGDTILTVPAMRAVRDRYPEARLVLLGKAVASEFVKPLGLVDDVIEVDKHLFDRPSSILNPRAIASLADMLLRLRHERAETVILFHHLVSRWGSWKLALLALATGARERAGLDNGRGWFLTSSVKDQGFGARHEAKYWMDVASLVDASGELRLEAPVSVSDRASAARLLASVPSGRSLLAIHPGTGWYGPGRRWAARGFVEAAHLLLRDKDMTCVLVGTKGDAAAAREVAEGLDCNVVDLVGRTTIGELGAVLERCALLLANDGGVAHLAAATDTLVVTIFGPSNDRAWRPLGGEIVTMDLPCRPCFYRDFETGLPNGCATRECLTLVTPETVARTALSVLRERAIAG